MKKVKGILLILVGITAIALSVATLNMDTGSTVSNYSYGGDAYTGMQNASAQTARNVVALAEIARVGFGSVLLVSGMGMTAFGIGSVCETVDKRKNDGEKSNEVEQ